MSSQYFALSIRFLDPTFHGRGDGGLPEWPPSPLRVFQSLVAAAAAIERGNEISSQSRSALEWLERLTAPTILTPASVTAASGYALSVPNNAMDIVASAWCRGNESNPAKHRTMKTVCPTFLLDGDALHYLWTLPNPLPNEIQNYINKIAEIARSLVVLGWGIDLVVGYGETQSEDQVAALSGERWLPGNSTTGEGLRVPIQGTLDNLLHRHEQCLRRLSPDGFAAPPPLSTYNTVEYRRATDPPKCPVAAFSLLKLDASGFRAFDTTRRALTVAGMLRYATKIAAQDSGWAETKIDTFVLGHGPADDKERHVAVGPQRFAYLPLPSIEGRGEGKARVVGSVRRALLAVLAGDCVKEIDWARRILAGHELIGEKKKQPVALLSLLPASDHMVRCYTQPSACWATVTPVVLPGYDDPKHYRRRLKRGVGAEEQKRLLAQLDTRIDRLLRKAILQAGFSPVLAEQAKLEWRKAGFWPGSELANRYGIPHHLKRFPSFHVKVQWYDEQGRTKRIPGPLCLGGGRFHGLGLFAPFAEDDEIFRH